ncbi:MAG TPA: hypothetical protein VGJ39_12100 [Vicinamibacterales bacterium]
MSGPTPILDFFKRGEVARDVRLLAAQGTLAPRANEQLEILVLLLEDPDPEIRQVADATLNKIPIETLQGFLARSDVSIGLREFFGDRGVFPAEIPAIEVDEPLIDTAPAEWVEDEAPTEADRESIMQKLGQMSFTDRLKAAMKGTKEMRSILIRDPNKMISAAVLSSPKVTDSEAASYARMASVSEDILRAIGHNRAWMKSYAVVLGLARNPKTPVAMSLNLLARLQNRDVQAISVDRNVPEPLRIAARKKVVANIEGKG